jgi:outer membrane protein TolC
MDVHDIDVHAERRATLDRLNDLAEEARAQYSAGMITFSERVDALTKIARERTRLTGSMGPEYMLGGA